MWADDPTQWPSLTYPDVYHYLIRTPGKLILFITFHLASYILFESISYLY